MAADTGLDRVAVVGTSCSGKTTFARVLSARLSLPHVELDALYWRPGWTPAADFRASVDAATSASRWIADGSYTSVRDLTWARADTLIWLDLPFRVVFGRAWARTLRRLVTREALFGGNREKIDITNPEWIPWWVMHTHHARRRRYRDYLAEPSSRHLRLVRLTSVGDAERFLADPGVSAEALRLVL
jgi:adenylate kinase family enzyme